jgi:hypothetical protein
MKGWKYICFLMSLTGQLIIISGRVIWLLRYTSVKSSWNSKGNNLFRLHPSPQSIQYFTPFIRLSLSLLSLLKLKIESQLCASDGTVLKMELPLMLNIWKILRFLLSIHAASSQTYVRLSACASYPVSAKHDVVETNYKDKSSSSWRNNSRKLLIFLLSVLCRIQISFCPHSFVHKKETGAAGTLSI